MTANEYLALFTLPGWEIEYMRQIKAARRGDWKEHT